jgi:hypothetical protein
MITWATMRLRTYILGRFILGLVIWFHKSIITNEPLDASKHANATPLIPRTTARLISYGLQGRHMIPSTVTFAPKEQTKIRAKRRTSRQVSIPRTRALFKLLASISWHTKKRRAAARSQSQKPGKAREIRSTKPNRTTTHPTYPTTTFEQTSCFKTPATLPRTNRTDRPTRPLWTPANNNALQRARSRESQICFANRAPPAPKHRDKRLCAQ